MKCDPRHAALALGGGQPSIHLVANEWDPDVRRVHADLVRPPRLLQRAREQYHPTASAVPATACRQRRRARQVADAGWPLARGEGLEPGSRRLPFLEVDRPAHGVAGVDVAADGRPNQRRLAGLCDPQANAAATLDGDRRALFARGRQCEVLLLETICVPMPLHVRRRGLRFREEHHSAGSLVQTMTQHGRICRHFFIATLPGSSLHVAEHLACQRLSDEAVHRHGPQAGRLGHCQQVVVLVEDPEVFGVVGDKRDALLGLADERERRFRLSFVLAAQGIRHLLRRSGHTAVQPEAEVKHLPHERIGHVLHRPRCCLPHLLVGDPRLLAAPLPEGVT
mmetsp:Transcript_51094/g.147426  ORF Transcript_51094/g.147426 Transcript_51094/m.147426 type:complete len:337 (-) Transcript_51094:210-1220(-)